MLNDRRILVWFSHGAASAVAAKVTLNTYGATNRVIVVNCDTRPSENSDNYRFGSDVAKWLGQEIVYLRNDEFKDVDEVFEKTRYMSGVAGARCTTELKKKPRLQFAQTYDVHVFGFTFDEGKRIRQFEARNPELFLLWTLRDAGIRKKDCYQILAKAGIALPVMYRLGFDNNNCPGCVKAQSPWYWSKIRKHFPDVFERRCRQSRELGVRLVKIGEERIFLDELPDRPFAKNGCKENLSCGPECGLLNL